jgi:hypothetical protein
LIFGLPIPGNPSDSPNIRSIWSGMRAANH